MASKPPIARSVSARKAMVEPSANSATPSRRATSTLGANSVAMPRASQRAGRGFRRGAVEAGDQAGARLGQRRRHGAQITRRHLDVAVVDQQQRIAGAARQFGQHAGLGVGRVRWQRRASEIGRAGKSRCSRSISSMAGSSAVG